MKRPNGSLMALYVAVFSLVGFLHAKSEDSPFHFDQLYPKNFCTKATEQCVHVWGAWDRVLSENVSPTSYVKMIDRSIGQLVLAQRFLASIGADEKKPLSEQVHYLSRVVGTVEDRFHKLPRLDADRSACLKEWITKLKQLVQQKLNSN